MINIIFIRSLFKQTVENIDVTPSLSGQNLTPLYINAKIAAENLPERGVTMESRIENKVSDLYMACVHGDIDTVKRLLNNEKFDINKGNEFISAINIACANKHIEIVNLLLNTNRVDFNEKVRSYTLVHTRDVKNQFLNAAFSSSVEIALLALCNNRIDKTEMLGIAKQKADLIRHYHNFTEGSFYCVELREKNYKKLQYIFADQKYKGMEFFISIQGFDVITKAMLSSDAAPDVPLTHSSSQFSFNSLSAIEKEYCLEIFSYALFADKKTDCSSESLQATVGVITAKSQEMLSAQNLDDVLAEAAKTRLKFFKGVFKNFILNLAGNKDLQNKLNNMYILAGKLDYFKSISARKNALKFAHLNLSCVNSAFHILPMEVKYKIAGGFFAVPEKHENRINEVAIELDSEEFRNQCGMK